MGGCNSKCSRCCIDCCPCCGCCPCCHNSDEELEAMLSKSDTNPSDHQQYDSTKTLPTDTPAERGLNTPDTIATTDTALVSASSPKYRTAKERSEPKQGDWDDVLNRKLLGKDDVTHGAIIDIDDPENLKAGNFQPSIRGVRSVIEALEGDTEAIDEDGLLLGSTEYPYPFTPKKVVEGKHIFAATPNGEKDCTVYKTKKHIIIGTYLEGVRYKAEKRVRDVAHYIEKHLED